MTKNMKAAVMTAIIMAVATPVSATTPQLATAPISELAVDEQPTDAELDLRGGKKNELIVGAINKAGKVFTAACSSPKDCAKKVTIWAGSNAAYSYVSDKASKIKDWLKKFGK